MTQFTTQTKPKTTRKKTRKNKKKTDKIQHRTKQNKKTHHTVGVRLPPFAFVCVLEHGHGGRGEGTAGGLLRSSVPRLLVTVGGSRCLPHRLGGPDALAAEALELEGDVALKEGIHNDDGTLAGERFRVNLLHVTKKGQKRNEPCMRGDKVNKLQDCSGLTSALIAGYFTSLFMTLPPPKEKSPRVPPTCTVYGHEQITPIKYENAAPRPPLPEFFRVPS